MTDEEVCEMLTPGMPTGLTMYEMFSRHIQDCNEPDCEICDHFNVP